MLQAPQRDVAPLDLREAAVRPMVQKLGLGSWLLVTALSALVLLGLAAWVVQLIQGINSDGPFWGFNIANFVTIIGVSYGGAVVSAVLRLTGAGWRAPLTRIAEATAVVAVIVGGLCIIPSVGRPDRMWEFLTRPNFSSALIWDFIAISTYAFASMVFFYLPLIPDLAVAEKAMGKRAGRFRAALWRRLSWGWRGSPAQHRLLNRSIGLVAIMIIPLAVSVHSVLAWAFAITSIRPWWSEELWPPLFVIAALYSGIALVILALAWLRRAFRLQDFITDRHFVRLGFILVPFGAAYLYMSVADFLPGAYHGQPATTAVFKALFVGAYAPWFWIFVVGGMVVPLLIIALPQTRRVGWIVFAAACVVTTFYINRVLMVVVPSTYGLMSGTVGTYQLTWVTPAITLGAVAAIPLLLFLLFRFVPILAVTEMEGLEGMQVRIQRRAPQGEIP
jgi:molybdopterin-containing oxidoreductase family membrane subunit